jgi:hypothetical protein
MITLNHLTHTYYNDEHPNVQYTSVTTLLSKYKKKFDEEFHATRVAAKRNITKDQVISEWREINLLANKYGTELHEILEKYLRAPLRLYIPKNDFERKVIDAFKVVCNDENLNIINSSGLKPEHMMSLEFDETRGIAGCSDIIEDLENNYFNVWDFKTNKKFNFDSPYREHLLFPLEYLMACEYNNYAIQISAYAYMYEINTGKKFNRGGLFYWDKEKMTFKFIPVPYMKKEAQLIIEHFKLLKD